MTTENKQIAAIILNYFGFDDTIKCINSVQKNLRSAIFLIDNSANQNEKTKLRKVFKNNKNIHMLFPSRNLGFAAGVNLGISEAINKGFKRFFLLNNDTILLNGAEVQLKNAFNKYPTAIIAPAIKWRDYINKGNYYHRYFGLIDNDCIVRSSGWLYYFTGCALAFDITFLEKVGNFNEKFFMYGEDVELTFRAQEKGVSLKLLENEFVIHEGSKSAIMASFFYEYHMARSHYLLCFLLFKSPFKKATAFLGKLFPLAIRACIRSLRYKSLAPLAALLLAPIPLRIRPKQG
jgi:GT2 family glycosyltransferase